MALGDSPAAAAQARFATQPATLIMAEAGERIELWDADDFDPWQTLQWTTAPILRYRQHKADGTVVEAYSRISPLRGSVAGGCIGLSRTPPATRGSFPAPNQSGKRPLSPTFPSKRYGGRIVAMIHIPGGDGGRREASSATGVLGAAR
jgi:hypothetical protein